MLVIKRERKDFVVTDGHDVVIQGTLDDCRKYLAANNRDHEFTVNYDKDTWHNGNYDLYGVDTPARFPYYSKD